MLSGYIILAVFLFIGAWLHPTVTAIGLGQDPPQFMWSFTWPGVALGHLHNPFITNTVDYPAGVNLLWNCSMLLVGTVTWPVTAIFGPVATFNLVETLALALSAWTAFLWLRRHVIGTLAPALGAALFGFSPGMLAHSLGHPHVTAAFLVPVIFILLEDILVYDRGAAPWRGALLGLTAAAQLLIGEEVLVTAAVLAGLALVMLAGMYPAQVRKRLRRGLTGLGVAAAVSLILTAGPLAVQFFGPQRVHGLLHNPDVYIADLLSFVTPGQQQWLAPAQALRLFARFSGSSIAESNAYIGIPMAVLLGYTVVRHWHRPLVRVVTLLAGMLAVLSLGSTIHIGGRPTGIPTLALAILVVPLWRTVPVPALLAAFVLAWLALNRLPVLENILPVRLTIYVYLFAGALLAVFLSELFRRPRPEIALGGAALAAALISLAPVLPYTVTRTDIPSYFSSASVQRIPEGSVALVFPYADPQHAAAMLWQASAGIRFRMPGGYQFIPAEPRGNSIEPPPSASHDVSLSIEAGADPTQVDPAPILAEIKRWNARTVIVGPMPHEDGMVTLLSRALGRQPLKLGGVYTWEQVSPAAF